MVQFMKGAPRKKGCKRCTVWEIGVVYPMHGAGLIEAIEEREILGEKDHYYIMRLQMGDMKVMVPRGSAEEVGSGLS